MITIPSKHQNIQICDKAPNIVRAVYDNLLNEMVDQYRRHHIEMSPMAADLIAIAINSHTVTHTDDDSIINTIATGDSIRDWFIPIDCGDCESYMFGEIRGNLFLTTEAIIEILAIHLTSVAVNSVSHNIASSNVHAVEIGIRLTQSAGKSPLTAIGPSDHTPNSYISIPSHRIAWSAIEKNDWSLPVNWFVNELIKYANTIAINIYIEEHDVDSASIEWPVINPTTNDK